MFHELIFVKCFISYFRNTVNVGGITTEQRNLDTAATEFQRRFHISADDAENRQRSSVISQVSSDKFHLFKHLLPVFSCLEVRIIRVSKKIDTNSRHLMINNKTNFYLPFLMNNHFRSFVHVKCTVCS